MKLKYPKAWEYFFNFLNDLVKRGGEPYKSKLAPYRKKEFRVAEKISPPFYWLFNFAPSLSPYKVVWKYIAGKISGKAEFSTAVLESADDEFIGNKIIIPNEKLMLVPLIDKTEAYYVSAVLNSSIVRLTVAAYVIETAISTHILNRIKVQEFDSNNPIHIKLSELSKSAHEIAKQIYDEKREELKSELDNIENEIDDLVAKLYKITEEELDDIRNCLRILKEGESEEKEIIEEQE